MGMISPALLTRAPQEVGKIKIGGVGKEVNTAGRKKMRLPVKFDHFVVTTRVRGADGNLVRDADVHAHPEVGPRPTVLRGVLMFETPGENFHSEMQVYSGKRRIWTCDGEQATNLRTGNVGACPRAAGGGCECKPYGRLHLQLAASKSVLGFHLFRTTSWESVRNIVSGLEGIYELFGTCYHCPVDLTLYPSEDRYEVGGDLKTGTSYKVTLTPAFSIDEVGKLLVAERRKLELARGELRLLAGKVRDDLDEADRVEAPHIQEEYFPDADLGGASVRASVGTHARMNELRADAGLPVDDDDGPGGEPADDDAEPVDAEQLPPVDGGSTVDVPSGGASPAPARTGTEAEQLRALLDEVHGSDVLPPRQWYAAQESLEARNGPGIRMWIQEIRDRLEDSPPPPEQGDLLGGT